MQPVITHQRHNSLMTQEDDYFVSPQDQRVFGAGIQRRRVAFVPAARSSTPAVSGSTSADIGERYMSIVLQDGSEENSRTSKIPSGSALNTRRQHSIYKAPICEICHAEIQDVEASAPGTKSHEASIAHQYCLSHSHPPSHFDRNRKGLKYLSSYGWDPDSRTGLGAAGNGILAPIKVKIKNDTVGLGIERIGKSEQDRYVANKVQKLDAKRVRQQEQEKRKRGERLRDIFYRDVDIDNYLGQS